MTMQGEVEIVTEHDAEFWKLCTNCGKKIELLEMAYGTQGIPGVRCVSCGPARPYNDNYPAGVLIAEGD